MSTLRFHLVVFNPLHPISGFCSFIQVNVAADAAAMLTSVQSVDRSLDISELLEESNAWARDGLVSDAVLHFAPSQIALFCVKAAGEECNIDIDK